MSTFEDAVSSSIEETDAKEVRQFDGGPLTPNSPLIYWIGWLFIAYILLYGLAYFVAPVIFGYRPGYYYPPGPFGRSAKKLGQDKQDNDSNMASKILGQIEKFVEKNE